MNEIDALLERYAHASKRYADDCVRDPSIWHRPDVDEFVQLRALLIPAAEGGEMRCQYALATIDFLGLCCESEEEHHQSHAELIQDATRWWVAAAMQGHYFAMDDLITGGVGAEADRVREACRQFEEQNRSLVGRSHGMPVYGPDFMQEVCRAVYGRVATDEQLRFGSEQ